MGIRSTFPQTDDKFIPVASRITIEFDTLVDHALVDATTIILYRMGDTMLVGPWTDVKLTDREINQPLSPSVVRGRFEIDDLSGDYATPYTRVTFIPYSPLLEISQYTVVVSSTLTGDDTTYRWSFTTGTANITEPPRTSTDLGPRVVVGSLDEISLSDRTALQLRSSFPENGEYDVNLETGSLVLAFNNTLDATSIDDSKISIIGRPADGHRTSKSHGVLPKTLSVVDNMVYITLGIAADNGTTEPSSVREQVIRGTTDTFYARVYETDNELLDPDEIRAFLVDSNSYVYSELTVLRDSLGVYHVVLVVPETLTLGLWGIAWYITIGEEETTETEYFEVIARPDLFFDAEILLANQEYTITISKDIRDMYGNGLIEDKKVFFYTEFTPYYASVEDTRLEGGPELASLPDYTLALHVWKNSMYADNITYIRPTTTFLSHYRFAREQFVITKTLVDMFQLIDRGVGGGFKKVLGEFEVSRFGDKGNTNNMLSDLRNALKGWRWVIENGGEMAPNTGHHIQATTKAGLHPNRVPVGRGWYVGDGANTQTSVEVTDGDTLTHKRSAWDKYTNWSVEHGR